MQLVTGDRIWVDDDGYGKSGLGIFEIEGYPHPLCGKGVVLHSARANGDENFSSPETPLETLQSWVKWTDDATSGQVYPMRKGSELELEPWRKQFGESFVNFMRNGHWICGHPIRVPQNVTLHLLDIRDGKPAG